MSFSRLNKLDKPHRKSTRRRGAQLQGLGFLVILVAALLADSLMDALGPLGYIATMMPVLALAGLLVWLGNRPGEQENRPVYRNYTGRRHQRKR